MKKGHVPMRMCVSCKEVKPKQMLLRFVKSDAGAIILDREQVRPGRGAYVCLNPSCLALVRRRGGVQKALKASLNAEILGVEDGEASL